MKLAPHTLICAALLALPALPTRGQTAPGTALPVRSVALFSSGVAYIEREGTVDGDAAITLSYPTAQINDLLQSLVLLDSNGQVQPVTYGAQDPLSRTLASFAVDVSQPLSRADLLQKLRGAKVLVTPTAGPVLSGQIVSVETRTEHRPDGTVTDNIATLNILTDAGLQAIDLKDARAIKLLDSRLDAEMHAALTALSSGTDDARRPVTLHFAGRGRRDVRVGYVTESPLWKISYRLVLGGNGEGAASPSALRGGAKASSAYLQGWALVENTTEDDWNGVHLSLVSGRPVSFIQDLYQPLYLPRPVVPPDVVASPYPQTHGANLQESAGGEEQRRLTINGTVEAYERNSPSISGGPLPASLPPQSVAAGGMVDTNGTYGGRRSESDAAPAPRLAARPSGYRIPIDHYDAAFITEAVRKSVTAEAQGADAGEQYAYTIASPVTLARRLAAMIPVVAQDISGDKVLLFNADSDPRNPLDAVRLRNTTNLHLKGGPVALFDDGTYAGDARMEDVAPGESRLISYAVDLSVHGERQASGTNSVRTTLSIKRGVMQVARRTHSETKYTFHSQATGPRTVLVEHPYDSAQTLISPAKADERTPDVYRFAVPVLPGKTATLTVVTERPIYTEVTLMDADIDTITAYLSMTRGGNVLDISPATRSALEGVVQRRRQIDTLREAATNRTGRIASFTADQERIRKNMAALDKASALYKRYASELDAQETRIQQARTDADALNAKASAAEQSLRDYLDTLTL